MINIIVDVMGWLGAGLLLLPYYLISQGRLKAQSKAYQVMNVVGSMLVIVNTAYYLAWPSTFVNLVWIFIGLHSLRSLRANKPDLAKQEAA